jgi:indolepyruvate ferredoxin oxidoreductase
MGDAIATNLFMLGYAFQRGLIPVSLRGPARAGDRAERRRRRQQQAGLELGPPRRARPQGRRGAGPTETVERPSLRRTWRKVERRACASSSDYQDEAYAQRYKTLVNAGRSAEQSAQGHDRPRRGRRAQPLQADGLQGRVRGCAALYRWRIRQEAERGSSRATSRSASIWPRHCSPARSGTGIAEAATFGPWMFKAFQLLAKFKGLRGTALDPFGYTGRAQDRARS